MIDDLQKTFSLGVARTTTARRKQERPPLGVPADLKSAVKKVRPIKTGGFVIPHPTTKEKERCKQSNADCKSAKHKKVRTFLTLDFKSSETPSFC